MKTLFKAFSVTLSVLVVLSLMPLAVSADALAKEQLAEGFSWSEDFEDVTQDTVYSNWKIQLAGADPAVILNSGLYHEGDGSHISYDIVNGVFGKPDNDASLKFAAQIFASNSLTEDRFGGAYPSAFAATGDMRFYRPQNMDYKSTSQAGLASYNDAIIHYSTEFAFENLLYKADYGAKTVSFGLDLYGNGDTDPSASLGTSNRTRLTVLKFTGVDADTAPTVSVFGEEKDITVNQKQWHRLDFVVYSDMGMDLYLDGVKVNSDKVYATGKAVAPLRGIGNFRWSTNNVRSVSSVGRYASPVYFDNTTANLLYEAPVIGAYNPAYDTTKLYVDMENTEETNGSYFPEVVLGNASASQKLVTTFKGVSGVYGKDGKVFEISNTDETKSSNLYLQFGNATYTPAKNLAVGDKVRIAFSMANKSTPKSTRYVSIGGLTTSLQIKADGTATFQKNPINCDLSVGKWNNFELIYTKRESDFLADIYVNGVKACDTVTAVYTTDIFNNVRIGYEGSALSSEDGTYKADGIYLDDFIFEKYTGGDFAAIPVTVKKGSDVISSTLASYEPGADVTVGQLKSDLTVTGAASYKIVDKEGKEKSDSDIAGDGYLVINTSDKRVILFELKAWEPVDEFDFNNTELENVSSVSIELNEGKIDKSGEKKGHTVSTASGLAGKPADDISLVMNTVEYNSSSYTGTTYDPFVRYIFTERQTEAFCTEFSILMNGEFDRTYINISSYQGESETEIRKNIIPAYFYSDGRIVVKGQETPVGKWEENQWYRIGISFDPTKSDIDFYLNGEKYTVATGFDAAEGNLSVSNVRVSVEYPQNKTVSGKLAFDDFILYDEEYLGEVDTMEISSKDTVNNLISGSEIYTKTISTAFDLPSALNYDATKTVFYTDDTYSATLGGFDFVPDGAMALVKDGDIYKYYRIVKLDSDYSPEILINGRLADDLKKGKLTAKICTDLNDENGKLILAVYSEDGLENLVVKELPSGFAVSETEEISLTGSLTGKTVKAFALESFGSMKHISKVNVK